MQHLFHTFHLESKKQFEVIDVTEQVRKVLAESKIQNGQISLFVPHTTASVRLNHHEPLLIQDIMKALYKVAPIEGNYSHDLFEIREQANPNERSNGHAHVKAFLLGSSEVIPVSGGALLMGEKQSIFFVELDGGRKRELHMTILGE